MQPVIDVAAANAAAALDYPTFKRRLDRINAQVDNALTACSSEVADPVRLMIYQYSVANAPWGLCDNGTVPKCDRDTIQTALRAGQAALDQAQIALGASS